MTDFIHDPLGAIHAMTALLALAFGAFVFLLPKGTSRHKQVGYAYVASMLALNLSALPITNMTGSFGLFHVFVLISLPTVILAMYHPLFGRKAPDWKESHFAFMFWSYVGLVAAFIAEIVIRLPMILLYDNSDPMAPSDMGMVAFLSASLIIGLVMLVAELIFRRYRSRMFAGR